MPWVQEDEDDTSWQAEERKRRRREAAESRRQAIEALIAVRASSDVTLNWSTGVVRFHFTERLSGYTSTVEDQIHQTLTEVLGSEWEHMELRIMGTSIELKGTPYPNPKNRRLLRRRFEEELHQLGRQLATPKKKAATTN